MKRRQLLRMILIALLVVSMTVLTACQGAGSEKLSNAEVKEQQDGTKANKEEDNTSLKKDELKYDPPLTITTVRNVNDTVKFREGEDIENNDWVNEYMDTLGIKFEYVWITSDTEQFKQKMNVMVASDQIPDMFGVNDPVIFNQLADADKLANLDGLLEQYASQNYQQCLKDWGPEVMDACTVDGKLLAIPYGGGGADNGPVLWIKKDWLERLGKKAPTNIDELIQLAYDFKEADISGTGTYGLAVTKDVFGGFAGLEGFFNGYGSYPTIWHRDASGKIVHGSTTPETRAALEQVAKMFADGLIDPEFGVKDGGKVGETTTQNKVGIQYGAMWNSLWPLNGNIDEDETAYWQSYDLIYKNGVANKVQSQKQVNEYYVVNKNFEHPEALIKVASHSYELLFGDDPSTAEKFGWGLDGMELFKYSFTNPEPFGKNQINQKLVTEAFESGDTSKLNGEQMVYYKNVVGFSEGDRSLYGHWAIFGPNSSQELLRGWVEDDRLLYNVLIGEPVESWIDNGSTLEDLRLEIFTKIITGQEPIEAFDKFVDDFNALGGKEATDQMNERYN